MSRNKRRWRLRPPRRYQYGARWLIAVVLLVAVASAVFGSASHRAGRQSGCLAELAELQVRVKHREPTALALLARKLLGSNDERLTGWLGDDWLWRPRVLVTWTLTDAQVPDAIRQIQRLGSVRELHLENSPLTGEGLATFEHALPDVTVLTRRDLLRRSAARQPIEHFAGDALRLLALSAALLAAALVIATWPLRQPSAR